MTVNSVGAGVNAQQQAQRASENSINRLNGDFDFFLKLFTTQLENQDPTEPLDTNQLTDQLTQFTQVEQQIRTNEQLESLIEGQNQSKLLTAVGFIGSEVETGGNTGELIGGRAVFSYNLAGAASDVQVTVLNSQGRAVFRGQGTKVVGNNLVVWDGRNSFSGEYEPDGDYTVVVQAKDAAGDPVTVDARSVGIVAGVESDARGQVRLRIGERSVPLEEVLAVRSPTLAPAPAPAPAPEEGEETAGGGDTTTPPEEGSEPDPAAG